MPLRIAGTPATPPSPIHLHTGDIFQDTDGDICIFTDEGNAVRLIPTRHHEAGVTWPLNLQTVVRVYPAPAITLEEEA